METNIFDTNTLSKLQRSMLRNITKIMQMMEYDGYSYKDVTITIESKDSKMETQSDGSINVITTKDKQENIDE